MIVMDKSVGMSLEQWWLPIFIRALSSALLKKSIGATTTCPNRFAFWSFGLKQACASPLHNGDFLMLDDFLAKLPDGAQLPVDSGDCEDGYKALYTALSANRRSKTNRCVRPIVLLVTDEGREFCNCLPHIGKKEILRTYLKPHDIEYAAVLNVTLKADKAQPLPVLGISRRTALLPVMQSHNEVTETLSGGGIQPGYEQVDKDYARMVLKKEVDGSVWDIKELRSTRIWHLTHALHGQLTRRIPGKAL